MSRAAMLAALVALGGCSSEAHRVEMPWSVPVASSQQPSDFSNDTTGSIGPVRATSQALPPVASASVPAVQPFSSNEVIVNQGDTLYTIAQRYHVPASQLMAANRIYDANSIKVGQRLVLPGAMAQPAPVRVASTQFMVSAPAAPVTNTQEHVVGSNDTLTSIARHYKVAPGELARANNFKPQDSVKAGQKLIIPAGTAPVIKTAEAPKAKPEIVAKAKPEIIAKVEVPAPKAIEPETTASLPEPGPMNSVEFRWPVRGRVVLNYGSQQGGGRNDGINIAVPAGTSVKAAENGVVVYAGSELKGYGKLVLIRHDNDYVTAYAHNSDLNVKRGDKVTRGQVIATAGQTGNVTQPQVHFEIRKGASPVDPLTHLSSL